MTDDRTFSGARLRYIAEAARCNSTVVAARVGLTAETVEKYFKGATVPRPAMVERLAVALDVTPADFFEADSGDDFDREVVEFLAPLTIARRARVLARLDTATAELIAEAEPPASRSVIPRRAVAPPTTEPSTSHFVPTYRRTS
ncbi:transcriptional regulator with XRE-family HTH domain [Kitasatospora sp. MAP12-15]|uniref:helix-turn-helix domain-containing protein n=1 Tax=unclassified Kitasatospora TaxID=2633591 RepID=UPI0024735BD1|nr:helix-turn-helix transcriptional regulator [Kitasatospora sp. MAP12-44]MDH6110214.1 transcriptional regulator with XRE-family HTH domain [Kitasatospora sp. MAP12-44]